MKRLSFNELQLMWITWLVCILAALIGIFVFKLESDICISGIAGPLIGITGLTLYRLSRARRIYYKDGNLYLFNMFSDEFIILKSKQIIFLRREGGRWRLCYWDNNGRKMDFSFTPKRPYAEFKSIAATFPNHPQDVPAELI